MFQEIRYSRKTPIWLYLIWSSVRGSLKIMYLYFKQYDILLLLRETKCFINIISFILKILFSISWVKFTFLTLLLFFLYFLSPLLNDVFSPRSKPIKTVKHFHLRGSLWLTIFCKLLNQRIPGCFSRKIFSSLSTLEWCSVTGVAEVTETWTEFRM